ncbi:tRNA (guanosine(46)-N7)-methyltransferase TrmB [Desulfuromonas sp. DDH964]|uniref:tRNA (guanosine(46)-N7)-methyltransferase TrmB n=1 Tax=Desulfuromonas sp. DDH964 TaxID=1823759 RepID=UPI00078B1A77|nr:tRNA (guanosine(46)-N7)-methyltransferase TrmB [Desulfuromonas sp. DDH964]AMV71327.1 tRNA (N7-methyl-G46)-methyltransferase [Desulfuromonas sp. DDH964]
MTQRIIPIDSALFVPEEVLATSADLSGLFSRKAPLELEIGCGIGDFILQLAREKPESNFLAIDIYNKGCLKTCRRLEKEGLDNVRVLRLEARYLLVHFCKPGELAAIYINCPDPWPKKRHRKRRLVNRDFLQTLLYHLAPTGELFFSSDIADYAAEVAEQIATLPGFRNRLPAPVVTDLPGYPRSKYMRRFLEHGQPIHFLHAYRDPCWLADPAELPAVQTGFRVRWSNAGNG